MHNLKAVYSWALLLAFTWLLPQKVAAEKGENSSLPITTQLSSMQLDLAGNTSCPTDYQRSVALKYISDGIRSQLKDLPQSILKCDSTLLGKVAHCPASNCSEIFRKVKDGVFLFSAFYWLQLPNENATEVYCNRETGFPEVLSCEFLFHYQPTAESGYHTLLLRDGVRSVVYCNRETLHPEPESCAHAHQLKLPSGNYTIRPPGREPVSVYCEMDKEECGSNWWFRVASLDFSNPNTSCPGDWRLITSPVRACTRSTADGCDSVTFSSHGHNYTRVCGRVIAHQRGPAFGFWLSNHLNSLDHVYLNGVSVTRSSSPQPRQHIWSFAASLGASYCPCQHADAPHPSFVGNHYFCETNFESGLDVGTFNLDNPLWDGTDCFPDDTCCAFNSPPWFSRALANATSDDIEVRLCGFTSVSNYSTPVSMLDLYVQ